ncbi:hypothetical protein [Xanthomonas arboricola]|uniref:hypothetical protein n=1 Tax=Xanthomonas arboricola TaxID=56448 RepID=UPI0011B072C2|nr:hypothetical protein [Xanthomonas arboricola]
MDIRDAAEIFRNWTCHEGMYAGDHGCPQPTQTDIALIKPITAPGRELLREKRVNSIGINSKDQTITAYLVKSGKIPKKSLSLLPATVDGHPILYAQGVINPVDNKPAIPFGAPYYVRQSQTGIDYYTCGSSISVGNCREAGTLGALVKDASGKFFGVSNNHVSGSCSQAPIGMPIVAPGILDVSAGNHPPFTIGFHSAALPLHSGDVAMVDYKKNSDFAIFEIKDPSKVSSYQQSFYDTPSSVIPLTAGMMVSKVGRTTGLKRGSVASEVIGPFAVPYSASAYGFSGTVYFDSLFAVEGHGGEKFSDGGDSGSLVVHHDSAGNTHAVGILFAGLSSNSASGGQFTLVLPIAPILTFLGLSLVSGHNV